MAQNHSSDVVVARAVEGSPLYGDSAAGGIEVVRQALEGVGGLRPHHHICLLYDKGEEHERFVSDYVRIGLERGERCFYIADDHSPEDVRRFMAERGVDVDAAVAEGRLILVTKKETYLRAGHFEPAAMLDFVRSTVQATRDAGYPAARVTGEMTWALGPEPGCDRVVDYEAGVNAVIRDHELIGLCQYNVSRFSPDVLVDIILTHPIVVVNGKVCRNFYYVPPEETQQGRKKAVELQRLMENLVAREDQERERLEAARRAAELERLQELDRIRTELIGAAAHEIANPIAPMRWQLAALDAEHESSTPQRRKQAVEVIERNLDRMARLVQDLLEVSRLQAGRLELVRADVDVGGLIKETAAAFAQTARQKGISLEVTVPEAVRAWVDEQRILQCLYNLVSNALKFTASGHRVRISAAAVAGGVEVRVEDEGIGLTAEAIARLFEPFSRAPGTPVPPGTGLGLFVCRRLIELHGGRIWAESSGLDRGSVFRIHLPAAPA